jgi:surface polysaccharide O-acyltransferase-like enzyme
MDLPGACCISYFIYMALDLCLLIYYGVLGHILCSNNVDKPVRSGVNTAATTTTATTTTTMVIRSWKDCFVCNIY